MSPGDSEWIPDPEAAASTSEELDELEEVEEAGEFEESDETG